MKTARTCEKCNLVIATENGEIYADCINEDEPTAAECCSGCEAAIHRFVLSGDAEGTRRRIVGNERLIRYNVMKGGE